VAGTGNDYDGYILNGQNDQHQFIEDMGQYMMRWGVPRNTGRVYAYLLVQPEPVGLDQIAADIGAAKSGVSVATRQLVGFGLARVIAERGSRRLRYEALVSLQAIMASRTPGADELLVRLRQGAAVTPPGPRHDTLIEMADVLQEWLAELPGLFEKILARRGAKV
jgi:hypothetical protein